jgi:hypothetical protein
VRGAAVELPASPADVRRDVPPAGKGFWLDLAAAATARLGGGQPSNARRYLVPLTKNGFEPGGGFNMIGNPYTYPVPFGGLFVEYNGHEMTIQQAVAEGIIDPVLYTWDAAARGYVAVRLEGGVMQPWVGYWLHCNRGMVLPAGSVLTPDQNILGPVRIIFQPIAGTRAATTAVAQRRAGTADAWEFPVRARGVAGMADVVLGVAAGATGGVDPVLDLWAPPAAPGGVRLTSRVGRGSLYADYRSPVAAGGSVVWDLEVSGEPGDVVTVSWPDLTQIPAGCGLVVRDGVTGEERFMRTVAGFTVVLGPGERSRRLTVTAAPAGAALALSQLSARREAAGTARITCKTSMPATVTGEIRTAAGVLVARVTAAAAGAGNVVLLWDGRDQHGARVPRGVYQCQVVGVAADGQTAKAATVLAL